ncbi:MAG TPA: 6-phospho-3-hexuloisomerase [Halanaerobiales bacterium]|nr:6-phospho-3-hexuloisomerase [Halanaerobiales bacterium]
MSVIENSLRVLGELKNIIAEVKESEIALIKEMVDKADRIFFSGTGRSKLMMKSVAMRFMQFGFEVFVVGETNTPAFKKGDLLIAASGSGNTESTLINVQKAKNNQGKIVLFTTVLDSKIACLADVVIEIPVKNKKSLKSKRLLPDGSYFEESILILGDILIIDIAAEKNIASDILFNLHANLE